MTFFILYLLMILENLKEFFVVLTIVCFVLSGGGVFWALMESEKLKRWTKCTIGGAVIFGLMVALIPSKKEMAIIAGAGITYEVVTSDGAKEIGGKVKDVIIHKLDEMVEGEKK